MEALCSDLQAEARAQNFSGLPAANLSESMPKPSIYSPKTHRGGARPLRCVASERALPFAVGDTEGSALSDAAAGLVRRMIPAAFSFTT
jgi:hypothetical protein